MATQMANLYDRAINFTVTWAQQNGPRLYNAYALKGGWEGWAQVVIAQHLLDAFQAMADDPNNSDIVAGQAAITMTEREQPVYLAQGQKADIVIRHHVFPQQAALTTRPLPDPPLLGTNIIELKCESMDNRNGFLPTLVADLVKINGPIEPACKTGTIAAVAFSVTAGAYNNITTSGRIPNVAGVRRWLIYQTSSSDQIWMWELGGRQF